MSDPVINRTDGSATSEDVPERVLRFLSTARWFAGKGRRARISGFTALPWLTATDEWPGVRPEIVEVVYPGSEDAEPDADPVVWPRELYQLLISYRRAPEPELAHAEIGRWSVPELGPVIAYDAAQDPDACRRLLRGLLAQQQERGLDSELAFHVTPLAETLDPDLLPQVFRGQQSNTSIMFGESAMIKLFRRLELGSNLDIAVHDALSRTGNTDVAKLFGWLDASWPDGASSVRADLAMAVEKLADAHEGWELALNSLQAEDVSAGSFAPQAEHLGAALREIHAALRASFPVGRQPGLAVAAVMKQRLSVAAEIAPALDPYVEGLTTCFDLLAASELDTQRVHGDFHLGQTLHTPGGWKIIDFEGEPVKTLAEREAPDSVWRDIAGMLRSFDYAAASVPGPVSAEWAAACQQAFLSGYAGGELAEGERQVLRAYVADKAVYEVVYEVRNRPDWVAIPLTAIDQLVGAQPVEAEGSTPDQNTDHDNDRHVDQTRSE